MAVLLTGERAARAGVSYKRLHRPHQASGRGNKLINNDPQATAIVTGRS